MKTTKDNIATLRTWIRPVAQSGLGLELSFDTRRLMDPAGSLFVALSQGNRDGHLFVKDAYAKGVRHFLLEKKVKLKGAKVVVVPNSLSALQDLAVDRRKDLNYPLLGITGSNGKTIVKEWLAVVLGEKIRVARSPGSYNSQLGVALSLLGMPEEADLGLVEAGISQKGEMKRLEELIQPKMGVMTHFGDAHAEGFASNEEKLKEKLSLFKGVRKMVVSADDPIVLRELKEMRILLRTVGWDGNADLRLLAVGEEDAGGKRRLQVSHHGDAQSLELPVGGQAALENALLVVLAAREFGMEWDDIRSGLSKLHPVAMRMEMLTDNPEVTVINDAYNADEASVRNALALLEQSRFQPGQAIVLSDMEHQGGRQAEIQRTLLQKAIQQLGVGNVYVIGPVFLDLSQEYSGLRAYEHVEDFLNAFEYERFQNKTVLLKGARRFELERIISYLSRQATATCFKINLDDFVANFRWFRKQVSPETQIMAMVKALAYGSGDWEVAQALEQEGVDYLAVAYTSEGIALRTRGIQVPVMVMNANPEDLEQLYHFDLEPEIYDFGFLHRYIAAGERLGRERFPVHIKVDTGMRRLGFSKSDAKGLAQMIVAQPGLELKSVMSHLARADEEEGDEFTHEQARKFTSFADELEEASGQKPMRHLLNTAGILRFPEYEFDMVRVGLGLYGISPVEGMGNELREVGTLQSLISQIHSYEAGVPIGYGGTETTSRESKIATVPIGYADGIRRHLSNGKMSFLVKGQRVPIVGRVCMDMLMLDVTDVPHVRAGDEVVLLGDQGAEKISVTEMAQACDTIPYEILVNIGQRVRRVYERES